MPVRERQKKRSRRRPDLPSTLKFAATIMSSTQPMFTSGWFHWKMYFRYKPTSINCTVMRSAATTVSRTSPNWSQMKMPIGISSKANIDAVARVDRSVVMVAPLARRPRFRPSGRIG